MEQISRSGRSWKDQFETLRQKAQAERMMWIEQYHLPPNVNCHWCGDTGRNLEDQSVCFCVAGEAMTERLKRAEFWLSEIPRKYQAFNLATCPNRPLVAGVERWIAQDPVATGTNLVIVGKPGTCKTGIAIAALGHLMGDGYSIAFRNTADLLDSIRADTTSDVNDSDPTIYSRKLYTAQHMNALVLDDIGVERMKDFGAETLNKLISTRWESGRPTIVTTNLDGDELEERLGPRITSRLLDNCVSLTATGVDMRRVER